MEYMLAYFISLDSVQWLWFCVVKSWHFLYLDNATQNTTQTTSVPLVRSSAEQRMQKLREQLTKNVSQSIESLRERYPEKQADKKLKGIQQIFFVLIMT